MGEGVCVAVFSGVLVAVGSGVLVAVGSGVLVAVGSGVFVGVGVGLTHVTPTQFDVTPLLTAMKLRLPGSTRTVKVRTIP